MLAELGIDNGLNQLIDETIPSRIRTKRASGLPRPMQEAELLRYALELSRRNLVYRSFIGLGYYGTACPPVIRRNILENPGWYTQYTPYQSEIAQGRLESLINFQTMICDLTGLEFANASLLDEATAAAEAMTLSFSVPPDKWADKRAAGDPIFVVSDQCFPQTIDVVRTRATPLGIRVEVLDLGKSSLPPSCFGVLIQYPAQDGSIADYRKFVEQAHAQGALVTVATDLLALTVLEAPGTWGADIAIGSSQRFGVPPLYGGPHAAFFSTRNEHQRRIPGRIIGASKDATGKTAFRLALQTREQHIRRDKATSNICTAQVLLANLAAMYAVYFGPEGIKAKAERVHRMAVALAAEIRSLGFDVSERPFFDTFWVSGSDMEIQSVLDWSVKNRVNFRIVDRRTLGVSLDELCGDVEVDLILSTFQRKPPGQEIARSSRILVSKEENIPDGLRRTTPFLQHPVFNTHHSETEMLRYIRRLEAKDLSLTHSMIPLGSCTMKLNASAEMIPITWWGFAEVHPFVPREQAEGYRVLLEELETFLKDITGFDAISLQPNAGSQGEYAGLLAIRRYHESRGQKQRNVCLIPKSAHGTNPASAAMAGMRVVVVECDSGGNVDVEDLERQAREHASQLAALMITYPSTHGVFEEDVVEICRIVHQHGGQVYMDGANFNALIGFCRPPEFGPDVCHLNLHKTFAIPHGGGGPGMGPIGVRAHLAPFLPGHVFLTGGRAGAAGATHAVSAAPFGSAGVLPISWAYIRMMGDQGLRRATQIAILNANYMAARLEPHFPVLYRGSRGRVAHECIVDLRPLKATSGVEVEDVAKRLMDYGFHAPTVSFPVAGTMMIEPTESESKAELDRFCDAMTAIRAEIAKVESGEWPRDNNPLKHAPHTIEVVSATKWDRPYSREIAAFPLPFLRQNKFWPSVSRVDNVYGDRNVFCTCPTTE